MSSSREPAVWFPTVRTGTGTDVFTVRLAEELNKCRIRTEIAWLPMRAEYAPWSVPVPKPPEWATVAHVNTWLHSRFVPKVLPVVATIHHSVHHVDLRPYKGASRAAYHRCWIAPNERRVLRRANRVIAVSHFVAETAKRTLLDVPMQLIYNGVDAERFRTTDRQRKLGAPLRLLYVGSWMRRKGVDLLAPLMRELGEGFQLSFTGGSAADKDRQSFPKNMYDIGRLKDTDAVISAMQDADAFLFPSRSEGLPLVVLEAMACGLPVVATRGSSLPEVVEDGVTGLLFAQDDIADAANVIERLNAGFEIRRQMGCEAGRRVEHSFSVGAMVSAYAATYRTLTGLGADHAA